MTSFSFHTYSDLFVHPWGWTTAGTPDSSKFQLWSDEFTITTEHVPGDRAQASTTYQGLSGDVRPGNRILIDDGRVLLEVTGVGGPRVRSRVLVGGTISDHKGINLPGAAVSAPALTPKDEATCAGRSARAWT